MSSCGVALAGVVLMCASGAVAAEQGGWATVGPHGCPTTWSPPEPRQWQPDQLCLTIGTGPSVMEDQSLLAPAGGRYPTEGPMTELRPGPAAPARFGQWVAEPASAAVAPQRLPVIAAARERGVLVNRTVIHRRGAVFALRGPMPRGDLPRAAREQGPSGARGAARPMAALATLAIVAVVGPLCYRLRRC